MTASHLVPAATIAGRAIAASATAGTDHPAPATVVAGVTGVPAATTVTGATGVVPALVVAVVVAGTVLPAVRVRHRARRRLSQARAGASSVGASGGASPRGASRGARHAGRPAARRHAGRPAALATRDVRRRVATRDLRRRSWPGQLGRGGPGRGLVAVGLVAGVVAATGGVRLVVVAGAGLGVAAIARRRHLAALPARRRRAQLPEALDRLAATLRGGASVPVALADVGGGFPAPLGPELAALGAEAAGGRPTADVLDAWASAHDDRGTRLAATALVLAASVGAAPARAADGVAATLRERADLADERHALAAQARMSAVVLSVAPIGFAALLSASDAGAQAFLLGSPAGWACLATGLVLDAAGAAWMTRLTRGRRRMTALAAALGLAWAVVTAVALDARLAAPARSRLGALPAPVSGADARIGDGLRARQGTAGAAVTRPRPGRTRACRPPGRPRRRRTGRPGHAGRGCVPAAVTRALPGPAGVGRRRPGARGPAGRPGARGGGRRPAARRCRPAPPHDRRRACP